MDGHKLLEDMKTGALSMNQVPCTECRANPASRKEHFHGSDWGKCVRLVWFESTVGKNDPERTGEEAFRLNDGHLHEALMLKSIEMAGHTITGRDTKDGEIKTCDSVMVPGGTVILVTTIGHTDGVLDGEHVVECKAVKDWAWKNKFSQGLIPPTYFGQVQYYLHAHQKELAFLVVKHRHTSEIMVFEIHADKNYIAERKLLLAGVKVAIANKLAIAIPKPAPDDECRFCNFWNMCWR